jgi:tetratricopeptide (TPR) repeat protein
MNPETGIAQRSEPAATRQQPESCGRCHSRRGVITDPYEYGKPLLDTHRLAMLDENLYHADGRILDEVYVYGSFVQSKMYRAGVTCSDCHNSHSGDLRTGPDPNDACAQCHLPTKFANTGHAPSTDCVSCHMQDEVYMGVDARRDHSFRLPDTQSDPNHYGAAIAAARTGQIDAAAARNATFPAIARATLLSLLRAPFDEDAMALLENAVNDPDPLVRVAALQAMHAAPPELRPSFGSALLSDPVRAVRVQAALTFVETRDLLPFEAARAYAGAAQEYRQSLLATASLPESMTILSDFEFRMGDNNQAIEYLEHAIRLDPQLAAARHSYGLALVRERRYEEALAELKQAHELEPGNARYIYVYAVALNSGGLVDDAVAVLDEARRDFPDDAEIQSLWRLLRR